MPPSSPIQTILSAFESHEISKQRLARSRAEKNIFFNTAGREFHPAPKMERFNFFCYSLVIQDNAQYDKSIDLN